MTPAHIPLDTRLQGKRIYVCVGAGGVGKTTVSAALALGLAQRGAKALVVSIDPAKRLATALGLQTLPGEPHRIEPQALAEHGVQAQGELWAMMLDSKRTFDGLIERLAPDERTREELLANRIYRELSSSTAGSQEFTAMAKLFELDREGGFDAIVLDTPPSRNALDFLDAPGRLTRFLEGRALGVLLAPGGMARGLLGRGTGLMFSVIARATGVNLLGEMSSFFGTLSGLLDGFSERARGVERLLRDPACSFLIVTSPEHEPAAEAAFFHDRLLAAGMPFGALVVNRVHELSLGEHSPARGRALLSERFGAALGRKLAANLQDFDALTRRDRETIAQLAGRLGEADPVLVGYLDGEIQDLGGLARIAGRLFA